MDLYLVAYTQKFEMIYATRWLETDSLKEINKFIMDNPYKENTHFPLLSTNDKSLLETKGKTVLLFADEYYFLHDINHEQNKSILRDINITSVLED
jgi:hypothetical protein